MIAARAPSDLITHVELRALTYVARQAGKAHRDSFDKQFEPEGPAIRSRLVPRYLRLDPSGQLLVTMEGLAVISGKADWPKVERTLTDIGPGTRDTLNIWTIFYSPLDAPGQYVLRRFEITDEGAVPQERYLSGEIEPFRNEMRRRGLVLMTRDPSDHESVVEILALTTSKGSDYHGPLSDRP